MSPFCFKESAPVGPVHIWWKKCHKTSPNCCISNSRKGTQRKMDKLPFTAWFVSLVFSCCHVKLQPSIGSPLTIQLQQSVRVSEGCIWHSLKELINMFWNQMGKPQCSSSRRGVEWWWQVPYQQNKSCNAKFWIFWRGWIMNDRTGCTQIVWRRQLHLQMSSHETLTG